MNFDRGILQENSFVSFDCLGDEISQDKLCTLFLKTLSRSIRKTSSFRDLNLVNFCMFKNSSFYINNEQSLLSFFIAAYLAE